MQFHEYMKYIDLGCKMACVPPYQWTTRPLVREPPRLGRKALNILGIICSIYQIIGVLIYWYLYERIAKDTAAFVAGIGEMCGSLMLTMVGFANIYALIKNRPQIEAVLEELQTLYPGPRERHYRCQHYYDITIFIMKCQFRFYMIFFAYYNSAPLFMIIWEHMEEGQALSLRTQTNTWFPWRVHGSALGFGFAYLSIVLASCLGVGLSLATQNIVCIFTFQLKLHYDAMASQLLDLDSRHPDSNKQLRTLIAYHSRILQIADQFNRILNFNFASSLVGSAIAICMTSVAVLLLDLASAVKAISGLVAFVLYQFVICYMGTEVTLAYMVNPRQLLVHRTYVRNCLIITQYGSEFEPIKDGKTSRKYTVYNRMQFNDYMKYLDKGCGMACVPRYQFTGRATVKYTHKLIKEVIFLLGTFFLGYQNIGGIIYWWLYGRTVKDTKAFVAELSEMCGYLMLALVGFLNIWKMTQNRPQIETVLTDLQELYPRPGQKHYRCQHYFELSLYLMKLQFIFYVIFYVYYNGVPILLLIWEYLTEAQILSFRAQTNTWYPWKVHGSAFGYSASFFSQALACLIGVGMSLAALNIVSIFSFQLKLHYDAVATQLLNLDSRHPKAHKRLKTLIAYHCRVLQLGDQFNRIMNFIFLTSLICSTIAICMTSVAVLLLDLAFAFKAFIGLVAFALYNFLICYMGTEVSLAVSEIADY